MDGVSSQDNEQFLQAVISNNTNLAKIFLEGGVNANLIDNSTGMTVLMLAAKKHNYKLCELLLDYGADLLQKNSVGETIFDNLKEDTKLIIWLEAQAKKINNQKFKNAALTSDLTYITKHFVDINKDTAAWCFVHTPSIAILEYLLKMGVYIDVESTYIKKYGYTGNYHYTLTALLEGCKNNNLEKVKWLLEHGASVNNICYSVRVIHGKDVDINDKQKLTALLFARENKNKEMIELIQSYLQK